MKHVKIYTDGACRRNPGPGGWGALLLSGTHKKTFSGSAEHTTNNRMELTAAIEALGKLKAPCRVDLYTDSKYLQQGVTQWLKNWKAKGWKTADKKEVKNIDLWQQLDVLLLKHDIAWHWVKGHSGHPENDIADALATKAIDDMLGS